MLGRAAGRPKDKISIVMLCFSREETGLGEIQGSDVGRATADGGSSGIESHVPSHQGETRAQEASNGERVSERERKGKGPPARMAQRSGPRH